MESGNSCERRLYEAEQRKDERTEDDAVDEGGRDAERRALLLVHPHEATTAVAHRYCQHTHRKEIEGKQGTMKEKEQTVFALVQRRDHWHALRHSIAIDKRDMDAWCGANDGVDSYKRRRISSEGKARAATRTLVIVVASIGHATHSIELGNVVRVGSVHAEERS